MEGPTTNLEPKERPHFPEQLLLLLAAKHKPPKLERREPLPLQPLPNRERCRLQVPKPTLEPLGTQLGQLEAAPQRVLLNEQRDPQPEEPVFVGGQQRLPQEQLEGVLEPTKAKVRQCAVRTAADLLDVCLQQTEECAAAQLP